MPVMKFVLRDNEHTALQTLAEKEMRDPRAQAVIIIRRELQRNGLLPQIYDPAAELKHSKGGSYADSD